MTENTRSVYIHYYKRFAVFNRCLELQATDTISWDGAVYPCRKTRVQLKLLQRLGSLQIVYRIRAIRHHGYYLFHHAILCGFYSRAATNRERHLLYSVVWVKVFCKCKGFEKSQFYEINEEFRRADLVLKQNFQLSLDKSSLSYKAIPTWHLQTSVY